MTVPYTTPRLDKSFWYAEIDLLKVPFVNLELWGYLWFPEEGRGLFCLKALGCTDIGALDYVAVGVQ